MWRAAGRALMGYERRVDVKKVAGFLVLAFVIFYVLSSPVQSAAAVRGAGGVLASAAQSMSTFVTSLVR